nr:cation transporter [Thauera terpenica]
MSSTSGRSLGARVARSFDASLQATVLSESRPMQRSSFNVPKMDCPSEENLVRMALQDMPELSLSFDLKQRQVTVLHRASADEVLARLTRLGLGAALQSSEAVHDDAVPLPDAGDVAELKVLRMLLGINAAMFVIEVVLGLLAQSAGLLADSLDMFADAAVYSLALYAVGRAAHLKVKAAHIAGWLQLVLALGALFEVGRRFVFGSEPVSALMMGVGVVALVANVTCLVLISRHRDRGAHMTASYIFSANDVLANLGVIVAGALVAWTGSAVPDLVIGGIIGAVVLNGARRILALR